MLPDRKSVERLTYELGAVRQLCRMSEISASPALQAHAKELNDRRDALEAELRRRQRQNLQKRMARVIEERRMDEKCKV